MHSITLVCCSLLPLLLLLSAPALAQFLGPPSPVIDLNADDVQSVLDFVKSQAKDGNSLGQLTSATRQYRMEGGVQYVLNFNEPPSDKMKCSVTVVEQPIQTYNIVDSTCPAIDVPNHSK